MGKRKVPSKTSWDWDQAHLVSTTDDGSLDFHLTFGSAQHFEIDNNVVFGDNVTDYQGKIKRGEGATTYLEGTKYTASINDKPSLVSNFTRVAGGTVGTKRSIRLYGSFNRFGTIAGPPFGDYPSLVDDANAGALSIFVARALKAQQAVAGLTALGEIGQTLRMIRRPAEALTKGLHDYLNTLKKRAKKRKPKGKKLQKMIADTWLEYSFGWVPLVNDIDGAMDALSRINAYHETRKVITAKAARDNRASYPQFGYYPDQNSRVFGVTVYADVKYQYEVRYKGSISIDEPQGPSFETGVWGLRMRDVVPTLWELIPYSFLVDYFIPVGKMLEAMSVNRSNFHWIVKGEKSTTCWVHRLGEITFGDLDFFGWQKTSSDAESTSDSVLTCQHVKRTPYGGTLVPPLHFEIPGVFSKKALNMAALLVSSRRTSAQLSSY